MENAESRSFPCFVLVCYPTGFSSLWGHKDCDKVEEGAGRGLADHVSQPGKSLGY